MRSVLLAVSLLVAACQAEVPMGQQSATLSTCNPDLITQVCVGQYLRTICGGQILSQQRCAIGCHDGACDVCAAGATQCSSGALDACVNGQWQPATDCPNGCDATSGACLSCPPGGTYCGDASTLLTCTTSGQWQSTACIAGCNATYHICNSCVPGTTQCAGNAVQSCGADGQWHAPTACAMACVNGVCQVCTPGAMRCFGRAVQRCSSNGQWSTSTTCTCGCDPSTITCEPACGSTCC